MDRYVVREPRLYSENQQQGQNMQYSHAVGSQGQMYNLYRNENMVNLPYTNVNPQIPATNQNIQYIEQHGFRPVGVNPGPSMSGSGIDQNYLQAFSNNTSTYFGASDGNKMAQTNANPAVSVIHTEYQNRNLIAPERAKQEIIMARRPPSVASNNLLKSKASINAVMNEFNPHSNQTNIENKNFKTSRTETRTLNLPRDINKNQSFEIELQKTEEKKVPTKADKIRSLQKSGPRAFCGSVEKVLKWHKSLQEIGITIFFEIVAKCVSVRAGEGCSKVLVVRDENGPAMQVVYYEIDFLVPTLKPPCTVRVVGKMMLGTCRLQAYNVRPATGDDMAILPRRAAVAEHHVIKLSKEFGNNP